MAVLSLNWGEMSYEDTGGDGAALVLLHGTGCDSADWYGLLRHMPPHTRTVRFDFRGHGRSTVPREPFGLGALAADVLAAIRTLELDRPTVVGHSLGGMVAMEMARREPRIAALVLLEGWTRLAVVGRAFAGARHYGALPEPRVAEIKLKAEATRGRFGEDVWRGFWSSVERFDGEAFLARAGIPILEAYGGMGRGPATRELLAVPPNPAIEFAWIEGAGHYLPQERPGDVARLCSAFVERCAQAVRRDGLR